MSSLAILGAPPRFADPVPFARPMTPELDRVVARLRSSWDAGQLTNGPLVRELEAKAADALGVDDVVAVSSCTAGLMLAFQALAPGRPVVVPSFTFSASAHAVVWAGGRPVFVECEPDTFQIDVADASGRIENGTAVGAVLATHVFGAPCAAEEVEKLAASAGVPAVFDAAHGFGATRAGRPIGSFGDAEVFSLSPTKPVVAGEGGLVATNDGELAAHLRLGRDYGNPGDYDSRFVGLNARMSEVHAATALESLAHLDEHLARRAELAAAYRNGLAGVDGIRLQTVADGDRSTFKDLTISLEPSFGVARDVVVRALREEGVDTRCYFSPPVHRHQAYSAGARVDLPVTDQVASRVLSLPIFASLPLSSVETIVEILREIGSNAEAVMTAAG